MFYYCSNLEEVVLFTNLGLPKNTSIFLLICSLMAAGKWLGINDAAAAGLIASLANSIATFSLVKDMDDRGKVVNIAFAVSAAFVFGDHLGFTAGFAPEMLPAVIAGKLAGGVAAVLAALWLTRKENK